MHISQNNVQFMSELTYHIYLKVYLSTDDKFTILFFLFFPEIGFFISDNLHEMSVYFFIENK